MLLPPGAGTPGGAGESWPEGDHKRGFAWVRQHLADIKPDVVFIPTARTISCPGRPVVTMVRNMEPLLVPFQGNAPLECLKNLARYVSAWRASRRASRVIAVSGHVRDFLVSRWRLPAGRVGVVYHGVEAPASSEAIKCPTLVAGRAARPFLFTAGSVRPARGLEDVIIALATARRENPQLALYIGGTPTRDSLGYAGRMRRLAMEAGLDEAVVWLGHLGGPEMSWCFAHCAAFVMTSRAEACPNILLEAMAHGCAIISTDCPPMPEFCGASAVYYRGGDAGVLASRLDGMADEPGGAREERRRLARELAARYSWEQTAQKTITELIHARRVTV